MIACHALHGIPDVFVDTEVHLDLYRGESFRMGTY